MSVRHIYVVCEGQTENCFVNAVLSPFFSDRAEGKCSLIPVTVMTSRDRAAGRVYKGGMTSFAKAERDIVRCLKNGFPVTTMFDFFRLPEDFPGQQECKKIFDDDRRVLFLEQRLREQILTDTPYINRDAFIPYVQMHEFEALFFCNLSVLKEYYVSKEDRERIDRLAEETEGIPPEEINHGEMTAPSKRLMRTVPYRKGTNVVYPLQNIGIDQMMKKCPHFSQWVVQLLECMNH